MKEFPKKTKIVATLGPTSSTEEVIKGLVAAGANMFRINTSHNSADVHAKNIDIVKKIAKEQNLFIPILIDLQGPKIRLGSLKQEILVNAGQVIILEHALEQTSDIIPVDYAGIASDVSTGDAVLIDDGKVQLEVISSEQGRVKARVKNGGVLKSRKGLNIPGATNSVEAVTPRDIEFIKFAIEQNADYIALSFVREKNDILLAKKYITQFGGDIPVIAKIEKPQAVNNIKEIIDVADGIMVARGDLGIELSPEKVPIVQKQIINEANNQRKVVIVATQMLETMIEQPIPTRAEASDVANAIMDRTDAIMLSGETAMGNFPKEAVAMMTSISQNVEESSFCPYNVDLEISDKYEPTPQSIVASAVKLAHDVHAKAILAFTHTGYSTRFLAKLRPEVPIIAISDVDETCRKLSLYWNVIPAKKQWDTVLCRELLQEIDEFLLQETPLQKNDRVILTGSIPKLISGRTNFIRVHRIGATTTKDV